MDVIWESKSLARGFVAVASTVILSLAVSAVPAHADPIRMDFLGSGRSSTVGITVKDGAATLFAGNVKAGELNWRWLDGTPAGFAAEFYTYCIDATQYLRDPQYITIRSMDDFTSPAAGSGSSISWLFNTYAGDIRNGGTGTQAAALQLAIWESLYDTDRNLATGNFSVNATSAILSQAGIYLSALSSINPSGSTAAWLDVDGASTTAAFRGQDQVTHQPVPEPSTLLLLAAGGLAAWRRRAGRPA